MEKTKKQFLEEAEPNKKQKYIVGLERDYEISLPEEIQKILDVKQGDWLQFMTTDLIIDDEEAIILTKAPSYKTVEISQDAYCTVRHEAKSRGVTQQEYIEQALKHFVDTVPPVDMEVKNQ